MSNAFLCKTYFHFRSHYIKNTFHKSSHVSWYKITDIIISRENPIRIKMYNNIVNSKKKPKYPWNKYILKCGILTAELFLISSVYKLCSKTTRFQHWAF